MNPFVRPGFAALAAVSLCMPAVAQEQGPAAEVAELSKSLDQKHKQLVEARIRTLEPVTVNGQQVTVDRFKRQSVFLVGAKQLEGKIAELLVEEQVQQAIEQGRDPKEFEISEQELKDDVAVTVAQVQEQNPGIDFWDAVRAQYGLDRESFIEQRRATKLFDRVFFPGPASEWPLITQESIIASAQDGQGQQFLDNIIKSSTGPDGEPRELPPFWMNLCRGWVTKQLKSWSEILYPSDGLPPDVCLSVNGRTVATQDAFEQIKAGLYTQDLERAMTEVVIGEALRQSLVDAGVYLGDEEFRTQFDEYRAQYDNTVFTTEVIATAFKGYPSLEAFRQRWRLMASFERLIEKEINDESLQEFANERAGFFADGRVSVDVIQILARDVRTGAWKPEGMERAEKLADEAMAKIQSGTKFENVLAEYGEYYQNDKDKGRLGGKALNQLRQALRESEFTDLLLGYSVGEFLFFEAQPGQVIGPLRGPDAYYIARVNARTPPRSNPNIQEERMRELVKQDYVTQRFLKWANEVVSRSTFE